MKISIVTASYNNVATIEDALLSIKTQIADDFEIEHIVQDGGSDDGTLEKVRTGGLEEPFLESNPDYGLYDALNKGIQRASGDIIGILHADDFYASEGILRGVHKVFSNGEIEACYGDLEYVAADNPGRVTRKWMAGEFGRNRFNWGWMMPHPAIFVRREIYEKHGLYRLDMGTAADYEWMLRVFYKNRVKATYIPDVFVRMRAGGVSNRSIGNRLRANQMDRRACVVNDLKPYPWTIWMKPIRKIPQWFVRRSQKSTE